MKKVNFHDRYLILSDIDGTLLNDNNELDNLTIKVISKLSQMGHIFALTTGRPPNGSIDIYNKLGLDSLMVNFNGAYISFPNRKDVYSEIKLGFNVQIIHNLFKSKKLQMYTKNFFVETNYGHYMKYIPKNRTERKMLFSKFHVKNQNEILIAKSDLSNIKNDVYSFLIELDNEKHLDDLIRQIKFFSDTLISRVWYEKSLGCIIEINSKFATKGTALLFLSSYYGISLSRCIAFGDGDNDAEMLKLAGYGYAMKNARTTPKLNAKYITKYPYNKKGVALTLIKLFNLKNNVL